MIINEHPVLFVDSTSLCYNIIFSMDFLDEYGITLKYDNNLVQWMEDNTPLCNTTEFLYIY